MRVSLRWLRELLPGLDRSASEVGELLTSLGLEVEAVRSIGATLDPVVIAEVRGIEPHPKRDQLRLVRVETGRGEQRVVCGAPNVPAPGGLVVLAPLGTELPAAGLVLSAREIGGVVSEGMLCSESELGIGDGGAGILVLEPGQARPGDRLVEVLPVTDSILELGITPNRPDALGHRGVARDLGAKLGLVAAGPGPSEPLRWDDTPLDELVAIENREPERCPHYAAGGVVDVTVGPSPAWLRYRLHALGVRPISNVVDVTNLLLLEYGQPLHAFDLDLVRGSRIVVRRAGAGEPFVTLDGVQRTLDADDLVIADGSAPSALAGVMGGETSEIRATTRRVLIECAYFAPRGIRRTSRRHGLHTESSHRFERGVDPGALGEVLAAARRWITELGGGRAARGEVHARGALPPPVELTLRPARASSLLGRPVSAEEARRTLGALGFGVDAESGEDALHVRVPSWRPDVTLEADLVEEVGRVAGLDGIPTVLPRIAPQRPLTSTTFERAAVREAAALGLSEALTYAFVDPKVLEALAAPAPVVVLANPMSEERSVIRTSLLPGLLDAVAHARRQGERASRLFAVGARVVAPSEGPARGPRVQAARPRLAEDEGRLPQERLSLAAVFAGPRPGWLAAKPPEVDLYDAKGTALELVERLVGRRAELKASGSDESLRHLHPRARAELCVEGAVVGRLGTLHPDVVDALDLGGAVQVVELDLDALESLQPHVPKYRPIPKRPAVARDVALVVPSTVPTAAVQAALADAGGELCESVQLFDVFEGSGIPAGRRSLAFRVVYRDPLAARDPERARTLTDREVDERHAHVVQAARDRTGAELRE
ncbi:MAG: phenylalanine--tRNA ligase subunit beta [Polyangiaceae bacterium]|nr:phenylalanine--tRNA ligase subunit beta [Polyangiaceae bacterium]